MNNAYGRELAELWRASSREQSLAFLRETVGANLTLGDLIKILDFEHIQANLHTIRLRDILTKPRPVAVQQVPTAQRDAGPSGAAVASVTAIDPPRRRNKGRRDRGQTQRVEALVRQKLQDAAGELATDMLAQGVFASMPNVASSTVALVLKGLERQGIVVGDRSRPRRWRLKVQGRRVPEPIVIRKAAAQEPAAPVAAAMVAAAETAEVPTAPAREAKPVALMTQAEIQAAAARLRERFFATGKG